ncbi:hypothetical protein HK104_004190, partial [Borealophlyctis nickersoniae]
MPDSSHLLPKDAYTLHTAPPTLTRCSLKKYLETTGITSPLNHILIELTKKDQVPSSRKVVVEDLKSGELYHNEGMKEALEIPVDAKRGQYFLDPEEGEERGYRIYVQANSTSRMVTPNLRILELTNVPEPDPTEPTPMAIDESGESKGRVTRSRAKKTADGSKSKEEKSGDEAEAPPAKKTKRGKGGAKGETEGEKKEAPAPAAKSKRETKTAKDVEKKDGAKKEEVSKEKDEPTKKSVSTKKDEPKKKEEPAKKETGASAASSAADAPKPAVPPQPEKATTTIDVDLIGGQNPDIVFSFDTTGSMYPVLASVRRVVKETITRLLDSIPNIRIAIIAHGDYSDANTTYVTNILDFTDSKEALINFVSNVGQTGGGDFEECYELVLREARTKLSWRPVNFSSKSLVMIGDAPPHPAKGPNNPDNIDWQAEARECRDAGIRCYAVQALDYPQSRSFYQNLAKLTNGFHLKLAQFQAIPDFLMAIAYREGPTPKEDLQKFRDELQGRGKMTRDMRNMFSTLTGEVVAGGEADERNLKPVEPSRFQILDVDEDTPIRDFVRNYGCLPPGQDFQKGKGFYLFNKPEEIQSYKE